MQICKLNKEIEIVALLIFCCKKENCCKAENFLNLRILVETHDMT